MKEEFEKYNTLQYTKMKGFQTNVLWFILHESIADMK